MTQSIIGFTVQAAAIIFMTTVGVIFGPDVYVGDEYIEVRSEASFSFAFGGVAFTDTRPDWASNRFHELGHLQHERELGILYVPVVGVVSIVGNALGLIGGINANQYHDLWSERVATEYGNQIRDTR